jgi:hypothetical protein
MAAAMTVIPSKNEAAHSLALMASNSGISSGNSHLPFHRKGPPRFLASFGMNDTNAVWPCLGTIVGNFERAKQVLFALQPFPRGQAAVAIEG